MHVLEKGITSRRYKWDNAKFFLILFVVLGHFYNYYYEDYGYMKSIFLFIYSFHMPAFIYLSGMFARTSIRERDYAKISRFLFLYIFLKIVFFLFDMIIGKSTPLVFFKVSNFSWYAFAIFAFSLMTVFLQNLHPAYAMFFVLLMGCTSGYSAEFGDDFCLSRIFVFFPFFLFGFYLEEDTLFEMTQHKGVKAVSALILASVLVVAFKFPDFMHEMRPLLTGRNSFAGLDYPQFGIIYRILYYIGASVICFAFFAVMPARHLPITPVGARSLQPYCYHYFLLSAWYKFNWSGALMKIAPGFWQVLYTLAAVLSVFIFSIPCFGLPLTCIMQRHLKKDKDKPDAEIDPADAIDEDLLDMEINDRPMVIDDILEKYVGKETKITRDPEAKPVLSVKQSAIKKSGLKKFGFPLVKGDISAKSKKRHSYSGRMKNRNREA